MHFETIATARLVLRKIDPAVLDFIFSNYNDEQLKLFLGHPTNESLNKERDRFRKGMHTFNKSFLYFQLMEANTGEVIGWCGYHTWYLDHSRAEIGYGMNDEEYRAKGYMSEALAAIIDYGFKKMKLNRLEAFIGPANIPSLKLVKKFDFTQEGHLRQHYCKDNKLEDSLVFSLLKEEYKSH